MYHKVQFLVHYYFLYSLTTCIMFPVCLVIYYLQTILICLSVELILNRFLKSWMLNWKKITWWFKSNSLCFNVNKTNFIVFAAEVCEEPKISIENRDTERIYITNFQGVVIDSKLSWCYHIDYIANGILKNIGIIFKVKNILNLKTTKDLCYSFIYPYLNHCCCCVGPYMYYLFV